MKTMTVGEFKAQFSEVIALVKAGEEIAVTFGKKKEVVGYFKSNRNVRASSQISERVMGPLKQLGYHMADDFCETSEEEFSINDMA